MTFRVFGREPGDLSISQINDFNRRGLINMTPTYQRKSVWDDDKRSFFIDSLLRRYPVPTIFLGRRIDLRTGEMMFDVIDGKQRLEAIFRFIANKIPVGNGADPSDGPLPAQPAGPVARARSCRGRPR